ncbi:MAG TPA: SDR family oxidoreductase [Armatimonadota bacterium]|nr:SDR family oxidoreductase [Armatimonadota bacterium]
MASCSEALTGKVALITGAGRGIGRAIAVSLAEAGCSIAAVARSTGEIGETAALVRERGREALALTTDVASPDDVATSFQQAVEALGPIDILVNNAGYFVLKPIVETSLEDFDQTLSVNLRGVFLCTKAVLPSMIERRAGFILNIASTSSKRWYLGQGAYCASKHGVLGFSKVLAEEMREHGVRVSSILPGGVNTRLVQEQRDDIVDDEWMDPEDIGQLAVFLATAPPKAAIDEVVIRRYAASPLHS